MTIPMAEREMVTAGMPAFLARYRAVVFDRELRRKFQDTFGADLRFYMDVMTGFDLLKFDDNVVKSFDLDGISMEDEVRRRWGEDGVLIIKRLLGSKPREDGDGESPAVEDEVPAELGGVDESVRPARELGASGDGTEGAGSRGSVETNES